MNDTINKDQSSPIIIRRSGKARTISEEYSTCSPNTKILVDGHIEGDKPTTKSKKTYTNIMKYNESNSYEKEMMITYGLIPPTMISALVKTPPHISSKK